MKDFIEALNFAQTMPDPEAAMASIPDLLKGAQAEALVKQVTPGTAGKIANVTEYAFEYKCARLIMGKEKTGFVDGQETYEDVDDSERLKQVMDMSLSGQCVISKKTETFLKDGTVVVWLEWLEPKEQVPKKERPYLTTDELLTPADAPPDDSNDEPYPDTSDDED